MSAVFTLRDVGTPIDFGGRALGDTFDLATTAGGTPVLAFTRRDDEGATGSWWSST